LTRGFLRFGLPIIVVVLVPVAVVLALKHTGSSASKVPLPTARLDLVSATGKLLGHCRARRVGSEELVAAPQPGSREQTLCGGRSETVLAMIVGKHPGADARLFLYSEYNKPIADCRARRVGSELVANPRPGSREQVLCSGARMKENTGSTHYSFHL
jgi:hypothetical protein